MKHIQTLAREGKIKGFSANKPRPKITYRENGQIKEGTIPRSRPQGLLWLDYNLAYWCNQHSVSLEQEFRFDRDRKWRFDYAIPALKIAVEYEGGIFMERSGHNSAAGIQRDIDKYTRAQALGWKVIRTTAANYRTALETLKQLHQNQKP